METFKELVFEVHLNKLYPKKSFEKAIQKSLGIHFREIVIANYNVKEIAESIKKDILKSKDEARDKLIKTYMSLGFYTIMVHHGDRKMVTDERGNIRNAKKVECEMKYDHLKVLEVLCHRANFQFNETNKEQYVQYMDNLFSASIINSAEKAHGLFYKLFSTHKIVSKCNRQDLPLISFNNQKGETGELEWK